MGSPSSGIRAVSARHVTPLLPQAAHTAAWRSPSANSPNVRGCAHSRRRMRRVSDNDTVVALFGFRVAASRR